MVDRFSQEHVNILTSTMRSVVSFVLNSNGHRVYHDAVVHRFVYANRTDRIFFLERAVLKRDLGRVFSIDGVFTVRVDGIYHHCQRQI